MIAGVFSPIDGLTALTRANYHRSLEGSTQFRLTNNLNTWGWVIQIVAVLLHLAGVGPFRGGNLGSHDRDPLRRRQRDLAARLAGALPALVIRDDPRGRLGDLRDRCPRWPRGRGTRLTAGSLVGGSQAVRGAR